MKNESNLRKNTIWNTMGVTLNSFISLFFLVIINRINGIEAGGVFSYAFSLACLFFIIGVYATRTYQISDVEKKLNDSEYLVSKILTCIIMLIVSFAFSFTIKSDEKKYVIFVFTLFKMIEAFSDTLYGYMQKKDKLYLSGISMCLKSIGSVLLFLICDLKTKNIVVSGLCMLIVPLLITILFDGYNARKCIEKETVRMKNVVMLFYYGFPIFIISFLSVYIVNSQKYVMNGVLNDSAQTIFGIILMPATVISLCGQYIMNPVLTELINLYKENEFKNFKKKVYIIIKILFIFWCVAEVGAFLLGIPVFNILYAIELSDYKIALLLILFGALFYATSIIFQNTLIIMKKNKFQVIIYSVSAIISFVSANLLIGEFGIYGAVYSYVIAMFIHCCMYFIYFQYELKKLER